MRNLVMRSAAAITAAIALTTGGFMAVSASAAANSPATATSAAAPGGTGYTATGALEAVAATSTKNAWAVGGTGTIGTAGTTALIVHWNGSKWSSVRTGAPARTVLSAVAASAPNNAWAIGATSSGKAVILRWNGSQWKQVSFSAPAGTSLRGVSVTSPANAWVVGSYGAPPYQMIALRWNGSTWKRASLPKLPLQAHEGVWLNSVSATSASNAWAVGSFVSQYAGPGAGFALHWNGSSWSRVSSAPAGQGDPVGVAATATNYAWLIGCPCQGGPAGVVTGLWNGSSWKTVRNPASSATTDSGGNAIAAAGHVAWAAGQYCPGCHSGNYTYLPLLMRWTGSQWKVTSAPARNIYVVGLAVTSATNAWAVGSNASSKTVILHWNGSSWH
jgi:hypothetical protein